VAAAASQTLDLDRVLHSAIEKITDIFAFDATQIHIFNDRTDELFLRAAFERDPNHFASVQSFRRGQGIVGKVAESGNPLIFEDVQNDPVYRQFSRNKISGQSGYRFFAVFPIRGKLRNLGTLACTGIEPRKLNPGEIQLLEAMADQIAVAIENGELYEQLRQKIEELQQANKVKDEFLSVMSHELRTPLNVVMGYTAMIKDEMLGSVNTGQRRALEKVITRSNDLLNMITSILYATSIEAKEVRVQNTRFALPDLFVELKRFYESSLSKPITLNWDYPSDMPVVTLDRDKVRVVLQKIIDNATKFTERGRIAISARVKKGGRQAPPKGLADQPPPQRMAGPPQEDRAETGKRQDGEESLSPRAFLEFKVEDTGVGITKEKLPIIFEKFRQADSSETRRFSGVGLGLYIAKHFVELMGGKIEVETEEGKGSIFTVRVPCAISTPAAANRESERQEVAGAVQQIQ
jgi:signal transduction histidine kinase